MGDIQVQHKSYKRVTKEEIPVWGIIITQIRLAMNSYRLSAVGERENTIKIAVFEL